MKVGYEKKFLRIFAVFLMFFYAETGISATITLCGEEYELDVPTFAKRTVSFTDKYGDEVQIYSLTSEIVSKFDNRTFVDTPSRQVNINNTHLIYVKDNKAFGLSYHSDFYFLEHNLDRCDVDFDFEKYNKIYPLSTEYNYDYSSLYGAYIEKLGYLGDNDSVGNESFDDIYKYIESKNNALTEELESLIDNAGKSGKGYTAPKDDDKHSQTITLLYDNESFNSYMTERLKETLKKGINHVYIANYEVPSDEEIDEYIRENDGDISDMDYMVHGAVLDKLFLAFNYTTPLMMSVYAGYNDVATYLLEHGANPAYFNNGADALLFAVVTNNKDMIYKLVEAGAPVILSRDYKNSVISYARNGNEEEPEGTLNELMNEFLDKETINYLKQNAYK